MAVLQTALWYAAHLVRAQACVKARAPDACPWCRLMLVAEYLPGMRLDEHGNAARGLRLVA